MYGSLEELVSKIVENSDLDASAVKNLIKEKELEFSGLISPVGAAHIVAKELGLNLLEKTSKQLKIENVMSGMNSVSIAGKIVRIFEPREFKKNGKTGKVVNIILGDETDRIRMSLWNEQVKLIEEGQLEENQVIEILNGYTKEDGRGGCEIRIGKSGKIKKSDADISVLEKKISRMKISDLTPGMFAELRGCLVQFFETRPFFFVCSECDNKLIDGKCSEHGDVKPKPILIVNGILDDGSENMRVVFFRDQAEKVLGMKTDEAYKLTDEGRNTAPLMEKLMERMGLEFIISGRTKMNQFFERVEFVANDVKDVDPEEEAKAILNSLEKK